MEIKEVTVQFTDKKTGEDFYLDVTAEYHSGSAGSAYNAHGDPGDAPEPPYVEILSVFDGNECLTERFIDNYALMDKVIDEIEGR